MNHEEALAYLDSLEVLGIRPGLDRIRTLLARLGDPQATFPSVLIAGTNGKGSVAADVASILRQAGHAPGVYTSPHLVRFEERIVVGETPIAATEVALLTSRLRDVIAADRRLRNDPPTYFEATTALAFLHFSTRKVPIAVLEVGMGGRFDATNVVTPLACAVTQIAMDHTQWLGRTLGEIAYQKAGILRPGVPAAVSKQETAALEVLRGEARRVGAPLTSTLDCEVRPGAGAAATLGRIASAFGARPVRFPDPPIFSLVTPSGGRYPDLALSLRGVHQVENAATAVLVAEHLAAAGVRGIDATTIAAGLRESVWPGRLELIPGRPDLLLDGAHNPAGCATLAAYLAEYQSGRPTTIVFAAMKDKPVAEMLDIVCPLAHRMILTGLPLPRGEAPETLRRLAAERHPDTAQAPTVDGALRLARDGAPPGALVVVSGSLYLVGEVKKILER
jgi:dihydrofolate synthase / folylpolyglutamate synthase